MADSPTPPPPTERVRTLFLAGLAAVYVLAFGSLWPQVDGLVGPQGLLPLQDHLDRVTAHVLDAPTTGWPWVDRGLVHPSLSWWMPVGWGPTLACGIGLLAAAGSWLVRRKGPLLAVALVCYLSVSVDGQRFTAFQWDTLLTEVGLAALLVAPWRMGGPDHAPPVAGWWLLRWILFRLMFFAGVVKLTSGDASWWDLSAMAYHYETQPLPNPLSWHAHHLPLWLHRVETAATLAVELVLPFALVAGRRARGVAFLGFAGLMALIALTGNYGFFQLLTVVLATSLLDDRHLSAAAWREGARSLGAWLAERVPRRASSGRKGRRRKGSTRRRRARVSTALPPAEPWVKGVAGGVAAGLVALSVVVSVPRYTPASLPAPLETVRQTVRPLRVVNTYGLFARMTQRRPIPLLQVRFGDRDWETLTWAYQPSSPSSRPPWVAPHMPRLDWLLWFAGLGGCERHPWAQNLLVRVVQGSEPVQGLIGDLRLHLVPPDAARFVVVDQAFTEPGSPEATDGDWWTLTELGPICAPIVRPPDAEAP